MIAPSAFAADWTRNWLLGNQMRDVGIGHDALVQERQRTVIVVGAGLALAVLAIAINQHLSTPHGGWFAYAPNTAVTFEPSSRTEIWGAAAVWLGAIAAWSGISLWLYRRPPPS